jgi:hypothetical protein
MFVSNGFLTKDELLDIYDAVVSESGGWLEKELDTTDRSSVTNAQMMRLRMSRLQFARFNRLRNASLALSALKYDKGVSRIAPSQNEQEYMEVAYANDRTEGDLLSKYKHLQFGSALKSTVDAGEMNQVESEFSRPETLSTNQRFLHLYDLNESLVDNQRFCPYKFDDLSSQAVDVMSRVRTMLRFFFSEAKLRTMGVKFFASLAKTVESCDTVLREIFDFGAVCASVKLMLTSVASRQFDQLHQTESYGRWKSHWAMVSSSVEYDHSKDGSMDSSTKSTLTRALQSIEERMKSYSGAAAQIKKLRCEALFLKRAGEALYAKASSKTSQRMVDSHFRTKYVEFSDGQFSEERLATSEASEDLSLVISKTYKSITGTSTFERRNGRGSMYTAGGNANVIDAFTGRGHLYQDARYSDAYATNPTYIEWSATHTLTDCNMDFGIYGLYSRYIESTVDSMEGQEAMNVSKEYEEEDDADIVTHTYRNHSISGTAFQNWVSNSILNNPSVRRAWRSVERLPTYAELVSSLEHAIRFGSSTDCFDGIETSYIPNMEHAKLFNGLVEEVRQGGQNALRGLDLTTLSPPFKPLVVSLVTFTDVTNVELGGLFNYEKLIVRDIAKMILGVSKKHWKQWTNLTEYTKFHTNKFIVASSGQAYETSHLVQESDDDEDELDEVYSVDTSSTRRDTVDVDDEERGEAIEQRAADSLLATRNDGEAALARREQAARAAQQLNEMARSNRRKQLEAASAQNRAADEEQRMQQQRQQQQPRRRLSSVCPNMVSVSDYVVIQTDYGGDCFYDSVSKILGISNMVALRSRTADFFLGQFGEQTDGEMARLLTKRDDLVENLMREFRDSPDTHREIVAMYPSLLTLAYQGNADEFSTQYAGIIRPSGQIWATLPDVDALASLLNVYICVYTSINGGNLQKWAFVGNSAGTNVPILWQNQNNPSEQHFVGLRIFEPQPVVQMDTTTPSMPPFIKWDLQKADQSYSCVYEAVAKARQLYNHPRAKSADSIKAAALTIEKLGKKHMASASLGGPPPVGMHAIPYAASCNLVIYDAVRDPKLVGVYGLGEAYFPLSCAFNVRLLRSAAEDGTATYTVA